LAFLTIFGRHQHQAFLWYVASLVALRWFGSSFSVSASPSSAHTTHPSAASREHVNISTTTPTPSDHRLRDGDTQAHSHAPLPQARPARASTGLVPRKDDHQSPTTCKSSCRREAPSLVEVQGMMKVLPASWAKLFLLLQKKEWACLFSPGFCRPKRQSETRCTSSTAPGSRPTRVGASTTLAARRRGGSCGCPRPLARSAAGAAGWSWSTPMSARAASCPTRPRPASTPPTSTPIISPACESPPMLKKTNQKRESFGRSLGGGRTRHRGGRQTKWTLKEKNRRSNNARSKPNAKWSPPSSSFH